MTTAGESKDPSFSDDGKWWWTGTEYVPASEAVVCKVAAPVQTELETKTYKAGAFETAGKKYLLDASKMALSGWWVQSMAGDPWRLTVTYWRPR